MHFFKMRSDIMSYVRLSSLSKTGKISSYKQYEMYPTRLLSWSKKKSCKSG